MNFLQKIRKTMGDMDGSFSELAGDSLLEAFLFFISLVLIVGAIDPIRLFSNGELGVEQVLFRIFAYAFGWVVGWGLTNPLVTHLFLVAMGWNKPMAHTFRAFFYGATPTLLFGWLPCVGFLTAFVSLGNVIWFLTGKDKSCMKPLIAVLGMWAVMIMAMFVGYYLGYVGGLL